MAELNLNKLPWYGQVGLFVALSAVALGGFYYYYVMPAQADIEARQAQLATMRADIQKGLTTGRQLPEFQAQVKELETKLEGLKPVLPEQKDYGELLRRLEILAQQSNITIKNFKPQAIATKQLHAEWPIGLEIDGTYHNLGLFFDKVSKFPRIINISNLTIRGKDRPEPGSTISAECTATTFVLIETPPATPPAGGTP
jgi:type IV pilus assembly protein PilO